MSHRTSRGSSCCVAIVGFILAPTLANAQFMERLSLSAHLGGGTILSAPQRNEFGFGGALELRGGVRLAGPLRVQVMFSTAVWPITEPNATDSVGTSTAIGGGFRVDPMLSRSLGGFFLDADAAFNATGADAAARFGYTLGAGWLFPVTGPLYLGPSLRFGQVIGSDSDEAVGRGTATYWRAGLEITLRAPPEAPAPAAELPPTTTVPSNDPDHDGIVGLDDQCPQQPENRNGFQDDDGCPDDPDPDHDNIPGISDLCPTQPETLNGFQDNDGCPDTVPLTEPTASTDGSSVPQPLSMAPATVPIPQVLQYEARRDRVERDMRATLDEVARFLAAHPEIVRIRIEGHADDHGNPDRDARLSRKRAQNVERYLRRARVARERMTSNGVGASRPCANGSHRCVDFVVETGAPGVSSAPADSGGHRGHRGRRGRRGRH